MIDRFARFSLAISEIDRCWHKLAAEEMAKHDLNIAHAFYLTTLIQYPQGITAAKLSELCCKNKADVSRMISILEKKGFIRKEAGYRATIHLTQSGEKLAETINAKVMAVVSYAGKDLSEENRNTFYTCLESLVQNLQVLSQNGLET